MLERLLICTDLDRTLIPNGPQSESPHARENFSALVKRQEVTLAYVSGRHQKLIKEAIVNYSLPVPDFVIGDVGTTIYHVGPDKSWRPELSWEKEISQDWGGYSHADLKAMLSDVTALRLQESNKQNHFKLSYYVPLHVRSDEVSGLIKSRFDKKGVRASLIWSVDEPAAIGLLDILPASASKLHAVNALINMNQFSYASSIFCGDSGNDIEVLVSSIPSVLVANCQEEVRRQAQRLASEFGNSEQLYIAKGGFMGMNGNYSAGILEGIAHFYPETTEWMTF